jgi:hypothetical protein
MATFGGAIAPINPHQYGLIAVTATPPFASAFKPELVVDIFAPSRIN